MAVVSSPPAWANHPYQTIQTWSQSIASSVAAGPVVIYLGVVKEGGITVREFEVTANPGIAVNAAAYHTFKPFISTHKNGVATVRYFDTSRATNVHQLISGVPYRIHDRSYLNERLPVGASLGVEIVTTGAPATSVRLSFTVSLVHER